MGIFKLFSGKSPEELEQKADSYVKNGSYGPAKIEYEKALAKLEKKPSANPNYKSLLEKKLMEARESLALEHKQHGEELIFSGCYEDAEELFRLSMELTENKDLMAEIGKKLEKLLDHNSESETERFYDPDIQEEDAEEAEEVYQGSDDEYFTAILSSLPETEQDTYLSYGDLFKTGYIALNQGDFETAVLKLSQAMEDTSSKGSFIPLELATAHMNLGHFEEARSLLNEFQKDHPESIKAYQLVCEILWEHEEFDEATHLLQSCPEAVSDSVLIHLLKGETLYVSGKHQETVSYYLDLIKTNGWNDIIARSLAKTYETLGLNEKARDLYGEIMNACTGCGNRIDPFVKQRYADTSLETGDSSTKILELYFDLTREDPENKSHYYQKISNIYSMQGNEKEARRFLSFAQKK